MFDYDSYSQINEYKLESLPFGLGPFVCWVTTRRAGGHWSWNLCHMVRR